MKNIKEIVLAAALAVGIAPAANATVEKGYTGKAYTKNTPACGRFSSYQELEGALKSGSVELIEYVLKGDDCVMLKDGLEVVVVDTGSTWAEFRVRNSKGEFIKAYTVRPFLHVNKEL